MPLTVTFKLFPPGRDGQRDRTQVPHGEATPVVLQFEGRGLSPEGLIRPHLLLLTSANLFIVTPTVQSRSVRVKAKAEDVRPVL